MYQTILNKENLDIRKDHAAYLGRELQKAYLALKYNLEYVQELIALESGDYQIILRDNTKVKLSRNYRDALYDRLNASG